MEKSHEQLRIEEQAMNRTQPGLGMKPEALARPCRPRTLAGFAEALQGDVSDIRPGPTAEDARDFAGGIASVHRLA